MDILLNLVFMPWMIKFGTEPIFYIKMSKFSHFHSNKVCESKFTCIFILKLYKNEQ